MIGHLRRGGGILAVVTFAAASGAAPTAPIPPKAAPDAKTLTPVPMVRRDVFVPALGKTVTTLAPPSKYYVPTQRVPADFVPVVRQEPFYCVGTDTCRFGRMPYYNQENPNFASLTVPSSILQHESAPVQGTPGTDAQGHPFIVLNNPPGVVDPYFQSWMPYGPWIQDVGALSGVVTASNTCGPTAEAMVRVALLAAKSPSTTLSPGSHMEMFQSPSAFTPPVLNGKLAIDHNTRAVPPGLVGTSPPLQPGQYGWQMTREDITRVHLSSIWQNTDPTFGGNFDAFLSENTSYSPPGHAQTGTVVDPTVLTGLIRQRHAIVLSIQFYRVALSDFDTSAAGTVTHHHRIDFQKVGGHALAVDGFDGADAGNPKFFIHDPSFGWGFHRAFDKLTSAENHGANAANNNTTLEYALPDNRTEVYNVTYWTQRATSVTAFKEGDEVGFLTEYFALSMN